MNWWADGIPQRPALSDKLVDWDAFVTVGGEEFIQKRRVLEIGPEYGLDTLWFAPKAGRWTVVDNAPDVLQWIAGMSRLMPGIELIKADCRKLPFPEGEFHLVIDFGSFDNSGDPFAAYSEATRVLCHHGMLLSTYANAAVLGQHPDPTKEIRLYPDRLLDHLCERGMWIRHKARHDQARAVVVAQKGGEPYGTCTWWSTSVCTCPRNEVRV